MELINYMLAALVVFLGPFLGAVLMFIAPEEYKPGKKYFLWLRDLMLFLPVLIMIFYSRLAIILLIALLIARRFKKDSFGYVILGIVFYLSSGWQDLFLIIGSMIFIYGLAVGTLFTGDKVKDKNQVLKKIFLRYWLFLLVATLLYYIP